PDTHYTAENGISVYYESAVWPVCEMTEDATLGRALELASAQSSDDANYQVVLFQKGIVTYGCLPKSVALRMVIKQE
ncbi:hypothetical protein LEA_12452, partial [human gut metagenome]